ncbi:S66 peptidase family protein [Glycomyces terrestris]|uniref:LD-carboxypeptidase n=1 Tax=Glycomyces terrestris TaxID=2493553 RepID=A0A426UTN5_9ACTN|nr:LD-carboxypeptidase [Glycomyces terrestris]RRR96905.1 LD-carboxypeptidase [Glycomyces terrestris]
MRALRRPRRLVPGDRVAVVSPAGPSPTANLEAGLGVLRSWGLEPVLLPHAAAQGAYLAGGDAERAADFEAAWADPSFAAVIAARGGYGAQRMLDRVDWVRLRGAEPKALVGFSDVTALHEAVALKLGTATIHGPMPAWSAFAADEAMREHLRLTLFEPERVQVLAPRFAKPITGGRATGVTVGGTLTLLAAGIGTAEHRESLAGGLLLLEDVGEAPYRLDRALTQLRRAGWFDGIAGVVLGSWVECGPEAEVRALFEDLLGDLGVPVVWDFCFGHCPNTLTVPLGLKATLDADAGTLAFAEPALR